MSPMSDFTTVTTPTRLGPDLFEARVPDGWQQGRGAFGGLVVAHLVRSIEAFARGETPTSPPPALEATPERSLRSLTAEICGPVLPGPNTIRVERLRTGTGVSTVAARLERDGEVLAHAVGVLGRPRGAATDDFCELPRPAMPPWREMTPIGRNEMGPSFARFLEFRPLGPAPFTSSTADTVASGWIRPVEPGPARDSAYVAALADAWWPAVLTRFTAPRPVATVAFTLELLSNLEGLDPEAPLFHSAQAVACRGGYLVEMRQLWGEDGRLIALNQQTIVIIK